MILFVISYCQKLSTSRKSVAAEAPCLWWPSAQLAALVPHFLLTKWWARFKITKIDGKFYSKKKNRIFKDLYKISFNFETDSKEKSMRMIMIANIMFLRKPVLSLQNLEFLVLSVWSMFIPESFTLRLSEVRVLKIVVNLTLVKYVSVYINRASKMKFFCCQGIFLHNFWFQKWL